MKSKVKQSRVLVRFTDGTEKLYEAKGFDCEYQFTGNFLIVFTKPTKYVYPLDKITSVDYEYNEY